jgi:guanylate kinase
MQRGKLFVFCGPSGSGKTTIVKYLLANVSGLKFSVSATSRPKRDGEVDGRDYYFISLEEFKRKINKNEFLEWEEVYKGSYYGTLKSEVDRVLDEGNSLIFDIDVKGGLNVKRQYTDQVLTVFVMPPSIEELRNRLLQRHTESEDIINMRIAKAEFEISFSNQFDQLIVNKDLQVAYADAGKVVSDFMKV